MTEGGLENGQRNKTATGETSQAIMDNPPEGMTRADVKNMSDSDLLDMHYFMTEDEDDAYGEEGFYIF